MIGPTAWALVHKLPPSPLDRGCVRGSCSWSCCSRSATMRIMSSSISSSDTPRTGAGSRCLALAVTALALVAILGARLRHRSLRQRPLDPFREARRATAGAPHRRREPRARSRLPCRHLRQFAYPAALARAAEGKDGSRFRPALGPGSGPREQFVAARLVPAPSAGARAEAIVLSADADLVHGRPQGPGRSSRFRSGSSATSRLDYAAGLAALRHPRGAPTPDRLPARPADRARPPGRLLGLRGGLPDLGYEVDPAKLREAREEGVGQLASQRGRAVSRRRLAARRLPQISLPTRRVVLVFPPSYKRRVAQVRRAPRHGATGSARMRCRMRSPIRIRRRR